ncbi:MAG: hypothetical protein WCK98_04255 [bacterium]
MPISTTYRINLVVDDKMQEILAYFRAKFPLLKDADLIKMAVSGYYTSDISNLPEHTLSFAQEQSLSQALASKPASSPAFNKASELMTYLDS